jgi:hypothetical protein
MWDFWWMKYNWEVFLRELWLPLKMIFPHMFHLVRLLVGPWGKGQLQPEVLRMSKIYRQFTRTASQVKVKGKGKAVPVTGLEWPRGFQVVKVPRFHDNGTEWW